MAATHIAKCFKGHSPIKTDTLLNDNLLLQGGLVEQSVLLRLAMFQFTEALVRYLVDSLFMRKET